MEKTTDKHTSKDGNNVMINICHGNNAWGLNGSKNAVAKIYTTYNGHGDGEEKTKYSNDGRSSTYIVTTAGGNFVGMHDNSLFQIDISNFQTGHTTTTGLHL